MLWERRLRLLGDALYKFCQRLLGSRFLGRWSFDEEHEASSGIWLSSDKNAASERDCMAEL